MKPLFNILLLLLMGTAWGLHFAMAKLASKTGTLNAFLFPTLLIIFLLFGLLFFKKKISVRRITSKIKFFIFAAALGYLFPLSIELYISKGIPTSLLAALVTSVPFFTLSINLVNKSSPFKIKYIFGLLVSLIGALFVLIGNSNMNFTTGVRGILIALLIPFIYAIYNIYLKKKWPAQYTSTEVAFGETLVAVLILSPFYIISFNEDILIISPHINIFIGYIVSTLIEVWVFFILIERTNALFVSFAAPITLLSGYFWGSLIFQERLDRIMIIGTLLILTAFIIIETNFKLKKGEIR